MQSPVGLEVLRSTTMSGMVNLEHGDVAPLHTALAEARKGLLDLSLRNNFLNYRTLRARGIELSCDDAPRIAGLLENDAGTFRFISRTAAERAVESFLARRDLARSANKNLLSGELLAKGGVDLRLGLNDRVLIADCTDEELDRRLEKTTKLAQSLIEEQGVNTLFMVLGALFWKESDSSERLLRAPLYLVPARLEKAGVDHGFRLSCEREDFQGNRTLQERLKAESVDIDLPHDDIGLGAYLDSVSAAVSRKQGWRVDATHVSLGFFSFTRYLMYLDLDLDNWPDPEVVSGHPVVGPLLGQGFGAEPDVLRDDVLLDEQPEYERVHHVLEADSSQSEVVIQALASRALVVQGPPGTGKSQTIANLLAEAVARRKRVLFVAEKMAALEVVKRRLDQVGLGDAALELHSNKAKRADVIRELKRTLDLGRPVAHTDARESERLRQLRERLNNYRGALHSPIGNTGTTPFQLYGILEAGRGLEFLDPSDIGLGINADTDPRLVEQLRDVAVRYETWSGHYGSIGLHPYKTVGLTSVLPTLERRLGETVARAISEVSKLVAIEHHPFVIAFDSPVTNLEQLQALVEFGSKVVGLLGRLAGLDMSARAWQDELPTIRAAAESAEGALHKMGALSGSVPGEAFVQVANNPGRAGEIHRVLSHRNDIFYRWFSRPYRRAASDARQALAESGRYTHTRLVDLMAGLADFEREGRAFWVGLDTWRRIAPLHLQVEEAGTVAPNVLAVCDYLEQEIDPGAYEALVSLALVGEARLREDLESLREAQAGATAALSALISDLKLDPQPQTFTEWLALLRGWQSTRQRVDEVAAFNRIRDDESELGSTTLSDGLRAGTVAPEKLASRLWLGIAEAWLHEAFVQRPELAEFLADEQDATVEAFRALDSSVLEANRSLIAQLHYRGLPELSGLGQAGVLRAEFNKMRRHLSIRRLMESAGNIVQSIKPIFMMSPLSVAVYLPRAVIDFDIVIFDEASQVRPPDALGALLRGKTAIVVGDDQQLPPTSFFDRLLSDDPDPDESDFGIQLADMESILSAFAARGAKELMLKWHYRSRHESLIAVSNQEFYEHKLQLFPSPDQGRVGAGIRLNYLPEASYDRGRTRVNRSEARAVAEAVVEHIKTSPRLSLGVATFSSAQAEAIEVELDILTRGTEILTQFDDFHPFERFFVKNLETVQGDERDVILISVGYGKDQEGRLHYGFGPLNQEGGYRRLNVLITRARIRTEIFANFTDEDMDPSRTTVFGVQALRTYLAFARTGVLESPIAGARDDESPFEDQVFQELRRRGYAVHRQVGQAGYFVDLAVADTRRPGRMILGIECDGAAYHSSRSARERDRLRQEVLEQLGWRIHRVWSTDWFRSRESCIARIEEAIAAAAAAQGEPSSAAEDSPPAIATAPIDNQVVMREEPGPTATSAVAQRVPQYVPAALGQLPGGPQFHELPPERVAGWLRAVVNVEAPVEVEVAGKRVARAYGIGRVGRRVRDAIDRAVASGVSRGYFQVIDTATLVPIGFDRNELSPRNRASLPQDDRHFAQVPVVEVDAGILLVCRASHGIVEDDIASAAAQLLGFGRASEAIQASIMERVSSLVAAGSIERFNVDGQVSVRLKTS